MAKSFDQLVKATTTKATRDKAARRTRELLGELLLSELRRAAGKSQRELADALGIKQPSLSKLEGQSDMHVGTLKKIVEALGGHLQILATFPKGNVRVRQFDEGKTKAAAGHAGGRATPQSSPRPHRKVA
jgi:plasmid maintenance system antidote protein VapI